jgi:simple sugar transport system ATP-binding protein
MVHQHFMLVPALRVWENVWLAHPDRRGWRLDEARARRAVARIEDDLGLALDLDARVADLPVGVRQRVEIAKALSADSSLLILDEPTAVLTPHEIRELFHVVRRLRERGTCVLFISHKLDEVLEISDTITVLRRGRVAAQAATADADHDLLTRAIVGADVAEESPRRDAARLEGAPALVVRGVFVAGGRTPLRDVSFDVSRGEILAIAGVEGNGQDELMRVLAGLDRPTTGSIRLGEEDVVGLDAGARWRRGLTVVPGDRTLNGLVPAAPIWENLAMREFGAPWARGRFGVEPGRHRRRGAELLARFDVDTADVDAPARSLSGGNQQKLLLARELSSDPEVIVVSNPTRGLDVGAAGSVRRLLRRLADEGRAVVVVSTDLDEVLALGSRWMVCRAGRLHAVDGPDREAIGSQMLAGDRR